MVCIFGMDSVGPDDPFLVQLQRGPAFGIEEYSWPTQEEARQQAITFLDPHWCQVVDREGTIIYSHQQIIQARITYCQNHCIRLYSIEVRET